MKPLSVIYLFSLAYFCKFNPFIKGIRHGLNNPAQLESNKLIQNLRLLGTLNMSFDLLVPPRLIGLAAKLVEQCGDTKFILDHCGNADPLAFDRHLDWDRKPQHDADLWKRGIDTLAKRANVICKISGIIARVPKGKATADVLKPIVNYCLDAFGPDRAIYGSDWPVCTRGAPLHVWTNLLHTIITLQQFTRFRLKNNHNITQHIKKITAIRQFAKNTILFIFITHQILNE